MNPKASFDFIVISNMPQADFWVIEGEIGISVPFSSPHVLRYISAAVRTQNQDFPSL
jgi:hypothetical protein